MRLLQLTPAETAFLATPSGAFHARLTRKLGLMLSARLRLPVGLAACPAHLPAADAARPEWQPDCALSTLWLTRRLGGSRVMGQVSYVPPALIHALDQALAECWLDEARHAAPAALAWRIGADLAQATLGVRLPPHSTDLTRWARELIRHG